MVLSSAFPVEAGLDAELTRVLLRGGARLDLWEEGAGPMQWAIELGLRESARVLAEAGVPIDNLLYAAALDRVDLLQDLLARGANVDERHWAGNTALHAAALMGHARAVTFLLDRGADPTLRDDCWKTTAAEKARYTKHVTVAELIEQHPRRAGTPTP
jgi:ankyrin repeat protein